MPVVAVVGPTASGKTAVAVELALALGGEVVNADSMQLYRGLDIGTAKPTEAQRRGVPHHLFDIWEPTEPASVAVYQRLARAVISDVMQRDRTPVLVGGSGLYVRAVLDGIEFPGTDPRVRQRLEAELTDCGSDVLHQRLAALDPAAAQAILPGNGRRIVRALEVIETTGQPFTATLPEYRYEHEPTVQLGLQVALPELDRRITERVDAMWARGLVDEVKSLIPRGLREGRTACRALGYAQVLALLDGTLTEPEARAEVVKATRRFARRQLSWFRRDPRVNWLPAQAALGGQALALARRTIEA